MLFMVVWIFSYYSTWDVLVVPGAPQQPKTEEIKAIIDGGESPFYVNKSRNITCRLNQMHFDVVSLGLKFTTYQISIFRPTISRNIHLNIEGRDYSSPIHTFPYPITSNEGLATGVTLLNGSPKAVIEVTFTPSLTYNNSNFSCVANLKRLEAGKDKPASEVTKIIRLVDTTTTTSIPKPTTTSTPTEVKLLLDVGDSRLLLKKPQNISCRAAEAQEKLENIKLSFSTHGMTLQLSKKNKIIVFKSENITNADIVRGNAFSTHLPDGGEITVMPPTSALSITATLIPTLGFNGSSVTCTALKSQKETSIAGNITKVLLVLDTTTTTAVPKSTTTSTSTDAATTTTVPKSTTTSTSTEVKLVLDVGKSPLHVNTPQNISCRPESFHSEDTDLYISFSTYGITVHRPSVGEYPYFTTGGKRDQEKTIDRFPYTVALLNGSDTGITLIRPSSNTTLAVTLTPTLRYNGCVVKCEGYVVGKHIIQKSVTLRVVGDATTNEEMTTLNATSTPTDNNTEEEISTSNTSSTSTDGGSVSTTTSTKRILRHDVEEEGEPLTVYIGLGICSLNLITVVIAVWTCRFLMREGD